MAVTYELQNPEVPEPPKEPEPIVKAPPTKNVLIGAGVVAAVILFSLGVLLGRATKPSTVVVPPTPTPTLAQVKAVSPTPTPFSEQPAATIDFLPGKQYFDDTFAVIEKAAPHRTLLISISRIEQQRNYVEYIRANYYTGQSWDRTSLTTTQPNSDIITNTLLKEWNDPSSQQFYGDKNIATVTLQNEEVSFTSKSLQDELSVQSQPGSTKFAYQGPGTIIINGDKNDAYVYRSRTYSFNASDLSFLTKPETFSSDWLVFWDNEGNFYNLDSRKTQNNTSPIQQLNVGIREDSNHNIVKSTQSNVSINQEHNVQTYTVYFSDPINERVELFIANAINKADKKSYLWVINSGEGDAVRKEGRIVKGIGILEFIKGNN